MKRLYIELADDVFREIAEQAVTERRSTKDQAAVLLDHATRRVESALKIEAPRDNGE